MGTIAEQHSDVCIVTSDNPRSEEPQLIITDILEGMKQTHPIFVLREEAIAYAISSANPHLDVILIAGKGHETYQEIHGTKYPFDDRLVASKYATKGDSNAI
jgi:UDP-N-acetylmuramoyl-L-alanyl-D-glutamate--2,6-diaminopimelate ligase